MIGTYLPASVSLHTTGYKGFWDNRRALDNGHVLRRSFWYSHKKISPGWNKPFPYFAKIGPSKAKILCEKRPRKTIKNCRNQWKTWNCGQFFHYCPFYIRGSTISFSTFSIWHFELSQDFETVTNYEHGRPHIMSENHATLTGGVAHGQLFELSA